MPSKFTELKEEFHDMMGERLVDAVVPPFLFLVANAIWGLHFAMWTSLGLSVVMSIRRVIRGESLTYGLFGVLSVLFAIGLVWFLGRDESFFLPGLVTGGLTVVLCVLSLIFKRPISAWASFLTHRWKLAWYWHPRVRPAYTETSLLWTLFFGAKFWWQLILYQSGDAEKLAWVQTLTGLPAIILLLVVTYLYGSWRLKKLQGPSVDEFKENQPAPWQGQQRGF
mgnify:CR=1 FL=1